MLLAQATGMSGTEIGMIAGAVSAVALGAFKLATYAISKVGGGSRAESLNDARWSASQQAQSAGVAATEKARTESNNGFDRLPCVDHGERLKELETVVKFTRDDIKEIKSDVKCVLEKVLQKGTGPK